MKNVIIYHHNCPDGWGSAWWLGKHLGDHVKIPGRYGEPPPLDECSDADVYIVDFCYGPDETDSFFQTSRRTVILDHHQTADEALPGDRWGRTDALTAALTTDVELDGRPLHAIVIDQDRSGVGLTSEYVRALWGTEPPSFLANIEDRDLWRFDLNDTRDVFAAVTARPYTEAAWDGLAMARHGDLIREGQAINLYRNRLIEQVAASRFLIFLGQHAVLCASSPYAIGSDVAGMIAADSANGVGAYVILHDAHVQLGLRSTPEGPDVAVIAEEYGGGGHKHASGLKVSWEQWETISRG